MSVANTESINDSFELIKSTVRSSFARLYTALKARELRTLRQLHAVRRQCETSHAHGTACVHALRISYDNEPNLIREIAHYGDLDLERLSLDGNIFLVEDYICPNEDHMYLYKCIDEMTKDTVSSIELGIEEEALKQITTVENCVCSVSLTPEEVSKQFREEPEINTKVISNGDIADSPNKLQVNTPSSPTRPLNNNENDLKIIVATEQDTEEKSLSNEETPKINPTEEWLNCIKNQIETEPTQATDVMEHSTIVC